MLWQNLKPWSAKAMLWQNLKPWSAKAMCRSMASALQKNAVNVSAEQLKDAEAPCSAWRSFQHA
jgi:hypothetical protein